MGRPRPLDVLGAGSLDSRSHGPSVARVAGGPITPISASVLCVSLIKTLVMAFRAHLGNPICHVKVLNSATSAKTLLPN